MKIVRYEFDKICVQKQVLVPSGHLEPTGMQATAAV